MIEKKGLVAVTGRRWRERTASFAIDAGGARSPHPAQLILWLAEHFARGPV